MAVIGMDIAPGIVLKELAHEEAFLHEFPGYGMAREQGDPG